jgi:hypothetical protein
LQQVGRMWVRQDAPATSRCHNDKDPPVRYRPSRHPACASCPRCGASAALDQGPRPPAAVSMQWFLKYLAAAGAQWTRVADEVHALDSGWRSLLIVDQLRVVHAPQFQPSLFWTLITPYQIREQMHHPRVINERAPCALPPIAQLPPNAAPLAQLQRAPFPSPSRRSAHPLRRVQAPRGGNGLARGGARTNPLCDIEQEEAGGGECCCELIKCWMPRSCGRRARAAAIGARVERSLSLLRGDPLGAHDGVMLRIQYHCTSPGRPRSQTRAPRGSRAARWQPPLRSQVVAILEAGHPLPFVVTSVKLELPELQVRGAVGGPPCVRGAAPAPLPPAPASISHARARRPGPGSCTLPVQGDSSLHS